MPLIGEVHKLWLDVSTENAQNQTTHTNFNIQPGLRLVP